VNKLGQPYYSLYVPKMSQGEGIFNDDNLTSTVEGFESKALCVGLSCLAIITEWIEENL